MTRDKQIQSILKKFDELTYRIENSYHSEEKVLSKERSQHEALKGTELSLTEYHVIASIGDNENVNGTFLANDLGITKGGVSKTIVKLIGKAMLNAVKLPSNRKEVYYQLTELGQLVYNLHERMHTGIKDDAAKKLKKYSDEELAIIGKFLNDFKK